MTGGLPIAVVAGESTQLVTVLAPSATATTGTLTAWERADAGWAPVFGPMPARLGSTGTGTVTEGSRRTPAGTYPLTEAFGRRADPGTALPYRVLDDHDWWVSDPASPLYDRHVRCAPGSCPFREEAGEHLLGQGAVYDHAVVIDQNPGKTPGAGSAFFLHVTDGSPTAGCVAVDADGVVALLRWLRPGARPLIAIAVG